MSLQFIIGGSGSGKTRRLYEGLIAQSIKEPEVQYFALVPEQFTMQTQKEIVTLHPNHGVMNIDIVSFERLAYRIFEELAVEHLSVLDDMGKSMVLRKVSAGVKKDMKIFGGHLEKAGFISELKSMLSEFFQYGITRERLEELAKEADSAILRQKLLDMKVLIQAFQEYTGDNMIAKEEILEILCRHLPESELIRGSVVTLDGYTGFTPIQYKVLEHLFRYCRKVTVTITMPPEENPYTRGTEEHLFAMSRRTVCRLIDLAAGAGCAREEDILLPGEKNWRLKGSPELADIERSLFRYAVSPREKEDGEKESVFLYQTESPRKEIQFLCAEISRLVKAEGYRYRDIAVITGDLERYSREIVRQFAEHEIPCFIDYKKNVIGNPMVELTRAALEVLQNNFSYETVFRYLKTGLALPLQPETYPAERELELLSLLENYAIALGIRSFKRWNQTWEAVYYGAEHLNLEELNAFRETVLAPLLSLREAFSKKNITVKERTEALVHFLNELQVEEKMRRREAEFHASGEAGLEKEFSQVYGLVMDLFDRITALLGEETVSRKEYIEILDAGFTEIKVGLIPAVVDRVVVGDITRTRLAHIRVLFFAGVNDGIVPSVSGRGGILSEAERRSLKKLEIELAPTAREAGFLQRFYLYLALTKPSDRLYLSWACAAADGKGMKPSNLITQIRKLFPGKQILSPGEKEMAVWSRPAGIQWVLECLKDLKNCQEDFEFLELYRHLLYSEHYGKEMRELLDAVFYSYEDRGIGRTAAKEIYSQILHGSVTRMEQYSACAYAHFLSYGLELKERPVYELAVSDIGNLFHSSIDLYFKSIKEKGLSFTEIKEEERRLLVQQCVSAVTSQYGNTIMKSSGRYQYLEKKVTRITERTIWALTEQLKQGDFVPVGFEVSFSPADNLRAMKIPLAEEEAIHLRGRIDRIDLCEDGDLVYLKIIDYKSGTAQFDLAGIYHGLQMQLPIYMDAALEKVQRRYPDKRIVPAGLFYYNIDDPMVKRTEEKRVEIRNREILKKLRMNGLANREIEVLSHLDCHLGEGKQILVESEVIPAAVKDNEVVERKSSVVGEHGFAVLSSYVNDKLKKMGREILDGKISAEPYKLGKRTACDYCPYHSVCGFDTKTEGFAFRRFRPMSPEQIWGRFGNGSLEEDCFESGKKTEKEKGKEAEADVSTMDKGSAGSH